MKRILTLSLLIFFGSVNMILAQVPEDDTTYFVVVELQNGEEINGALENQTTEQITIRLNDGQVRIIPFKLVKSIRRVEEIGPGRNISFYNVQSSRYLISGNALGMRKGEGYYRNVWIFINEASYGVTDFFSISAGLIPTFLVGLPTVPFAINPKLNFTLKDDYLHAGAGVLIGGLAGVSLDNGLIGIGYGNVTFGDRNGNITLLAGLAIEEGETAQIPALGISGMIRLSPKFYLLTENYILEDFGFYSLAGRTIWPSISLDYGLFAPIGSEVVLPWLGIMVPFN